MRRLSLFLGLALLLVAAVDPRPELIELQLAGQLELALARLDETLESDPDRARGWGLEYLRGSILEQLELHDDSAAAFTAALTSVPALDGYSRYRLALDRYRAGSPETAAGLLATILANDPPKLLTPVAVQWLNITLQEGGDCQLLRNWRDWNLQRSQIRELQPALIECTLVSGQTEEALDLMRSLLRDDYTDATGLRAAQGLANLAPETMDPQTTLFIGLALFHHREFSQAIPFLVASLEDASAATANLRNLDRADVLYSLARSHYWLGQYSSAVQTFTQVALEETTPDKAARSLFHRGRSYALQGDWDAAIASYEEATEAAPTDSWAAAAILSAMRLEWRQGHEEPALVHFRRLRGRSSWRSSLERASVFLAVSDLVRGRSDRAEAWLDTARQAHRGDGPEIWYWRGRLAELQDRPDTAVRRYLDTQSSDFFHPLSAAARQRLARDELIQAAEARAFELSASNRSRDLVQAWFLANRDSQLSNELAKRLEDSWLRSPRTKPYLAMEAEDPEQWPLWRRRVRHPEETLLALGIVETMSPYVRSSFSLDRIGSALAGSQLLATNGLHRRSLYFAEVLSHRLPHGVPHAFLPTTYRQLLYPRPYAFQVEQQARRFGIDPNLLTAIIREESRFDPMAVSGASARGLTQFVLPTAVRIAHKLDWDPLDPADLHRPEVAITLGAAYLAELTKRFESRTVQVVAAYNAGEDLAGLWQSYCFSQEPEEYFSKVGFRQTRGYLEKVLKSRAQYADIESAISRP